MLSELTGGGMSPTEAVAESYLRLQQTQAAAWISVVPEADALDRARTLMAEGRRGRPLWGVPFAVNDNIDVAGMPTTAACEAFAYDPGHDAAAVRHLLDAGAILVAKTNLDQFATGLDGTRSPYGICRNVLDSDRIAGGASAGSAVAVANYVVPFALATDADGSGRVPPAANGIVGLTPSRDLVSIEGVVPACRSIDRVAVLARSVGHARYVLSVLTGEDASFASYATPPRHRSSDARVERTASGSSESDRDDTGHRPASGATSGSTDPRRWRIGVPTPEQWDLTPLQEAAYRRTLVELDRWADVHEVDLAPLVEAGVLARTGPLMAERLIAAGTLYQHNPTALHPVVHQELSRGVGRTSAELFRTQHQVMDLSAALAPVWGQVDAVAVPTVPDIPKVSEAEAEPIGTNARLGRWVRGASLLGLCGLTVPSAHRTDGMPGSVTVFGPDGADARVADVAAVLTDDPDLHSGSATTLRDATDAQTYGAGWGAPTEAFLSSHPADDTERIELAVVGPHRSGLALHHQLVERRARFVRNTTTAPIYRLHLLPTEPPRPGMVRVAEGGGTVEAEVWSLDAAAFGTFVADVPAPLSIGTVELADGSSVKGFLCEPAALADTPDITHLGTLS